MKTITLIAMGLLLYSVTHSQTPQGFNYQAVLRNQQGEPIPEQPALIHVRLQSEDGSETYYIEHHYITTDSNGVLNFVVGEGVVYSGVFSEIPWSDGGIFLNLTLEYDEENMFFLGTTPINAVPYALFAISGNQGPQGEPGPQGEQGPQGEVGPEGPLVSGFAGQTLIHNGTSWVASSNIYTNAGDSVGIGNTLPSEKLHVDGNIKASGSIIGQSMQVGNPVTDPDAPLFVVRNSSGQIVFAVYEAGVRMYVDSDGAKASKGGFAVGGLSAVKEGEVEYFRVTPDSIRMYIDTTSTPKSSKGGFAVGGLSAVKGTPQDLLFISQDSVRIYIDANTPTGRKSQKGGFAVGGLSPVKSDVQDYLRVTRDSSRIYVNTTSKGASKGGFAVGGLSAVKSTSSSFMFLTPENYFIGHESGKSTSTGLYNSTLGFQSGIAITTGESNSFLGFQSGYKTTTGKGNIFIGFKTGFSNQTGNYNTFLGYKSGYSNTSGLFNTFLGSFTGYYNQIGTSNTFVGDSAGYKNTGNYNSYFGTKAGLNTTSGYSNVFIGNGCGYSNVSGGINVFVGTNCGYKNSIGNANVFVGFETGYKNINGGANVFIGRQVGYENTSGANNVFLGDYSGKSNTDGEGNIFIGKDSGISNSTGDYNVFVGYNSGNQCSAGLRNILIGMNSGFNNNQFDNIMIGYSAGYNSIGFRNVFIGRMAGYNAKGSRKLYIEDSDADSTAALIFGEFDNDWLRINNKLGVGRNPAVNNLEVEGTASKSAAGDWLANSDRRIKTDIQEIDQAFDVILKLHPLKFKYTDSWKSKHPSIKDKYYYNFIAQEFQQVFPESVQGSGEFLEGDSEEILQMDSYNAQIITVKAVQELILENQQQKQQIEALKSELEAIKAMLTK